MNDITTYWDKLDKRRKVKLPKSYPLWKLEMMEQEFRVLKGQVEYLKKLNISNTLTIYSASPTEICIGMEHNVWHRIVCVYEGDVCKGGTREYWTSSWSIDDKGFHLESFELHSSPRYNYRTIGWRGQYQSTNELKYDELPRDVLQLHHNKLVEHIKTLGIWYPCHIYNDFTGEMYRP